MGHIGDQLHLHSLAFQPFLHRRFQSVRKLRHSLHQVSQLRIGRLAVRISLSALTDLPNAVVCGHEICRQPFLAFGGEKEGSDQGCGVHGKKNHEKNRPLLSVTQAADDTQK